MSKLLLEELKQLETELKQLKKQLFVEMITDMIQDQTGVVIEDENEIEEIRDLIGSRVVPLLHKVCEWGIGKEIPTE
jgi:hypothetical protein